MSPKGPRCGFLCAIYGSGEAVFFRCQVYPQYAIGPNWSFSSSGACEGGEVIGVADDRKGIGAPMAPEKRRMRMKESILIILELVRLKYEVE